MWNSGELLDDPHSKTKKEFLRADYTRRCGGPDYVAFRILAIFMIFVWVVGVPTFYFVELHVHRDKRDPVTFCFSNVEVMQTNNVLFAKGRQGMTVLKLYFRIIPIHILENQRNVQERTGGHREPPLFFC